MQSIVNIKEDGKITKYYTYKATRKEKSYLVAFFAFNINVTKCLYEIIVIISNKL